MIMLNISNGAANPIIRGKMKMGCCRLELFSTGSFVSVGAITEMLSKLSPGDVESSVTGPVVVDSFVTSSVVATVVTMDPDDSVVTGGTEVG